jgi:hypothetical protein
VLERVGVQRRDGHVAGDRDRQLPPGGEAEADAAGDQDERHGERQSERDVSGGDGPGVLRGMEAVPFDVDGVVEEVGTAGRQAEAGERDERLDQRLAVVEHAGRARGDEHEHVLGPLLRPGRAQQRTDSRRPRGGSFERTQVDFLSHHRIQG